MRKTPFLTGTALLALFAAQPMLAQQTTPGTQRQGMTDQSARNVDAATKDFVPRLGTSTISNFGPASTC
jgi:hypothetical protein